MKSYNKLIVAVVLTLVVPMVALVVIRSMAPTRVSVEEASRAYFAEREAKRQAWLALPESERP